MKQKINFKKILYFVSSVFVAFVMVFGNIGIVWGQSAGASGDANQLNLTVQVNGQTTSGSNNYGGGFYDTNFDQDIKLQTGVDSETNQFWNPDTSLDTIDSKSIEEIVPFREEDIAAEEDPVTDPLVCSVGSLLGQALTKIITTTISGLVATLFNTEVPVSDNISRANTEGIFITIFGVSVPIFPSWKSIAYCLANNLIIRISEETKAWIRSGFTLKDGPIFVDDPLQLFQDLADYEVSAFLSSLGDGFLCEPFQAYVTAQFVSEYNATYEDYGGCTLQEVSDNVSAFLDGDFEKGGWTAWYHLTQNPANQPQGALELAKQEARNRINLRIGPINKQIDWGNGYFDWKDKKTGKTVTPGKVIQAELENRLGLDENRLVLADEFDEVVSELVNMLIKTALDKSLDALN